MPVSYGLRAEYQGTVSIDTADGPRDVPRYSGGVLSITDDRDLDVAAALDAGGGTITVDDMDAAAIAILDGYPALKRVTPEGPVSTMGAYDGMTVTALRDEARRRGIDGAHRANRDALLAALHAQDERLAAGDTAAQGGPNPGDDAGVTVTDLAPEPEPAPAPEPADGGTTQE